MAEGVPFPRVKSRHGTTYRPRSSASRRPAVDIRLTAPFFSRRYFITLLAGPEQRSQERLQDERARHTIWTVANSCLFAFLLLLFVPTLIGLVHIFANMG